jgi:multimeric flavodoxin WrbA
MKVLGISGSPRRGGNTDILVNLALDTIGKEGIKTEFLSLADYPVKPCQACGGCMAPDKSDCVRKTRPSRVWCNVLPRPTAI